MSKQRNQNPVVGDTLDLALYVRNSNNFSNLYNIDSVDIIKYDCDVSTCENPNGEVLIETIPFSSIIHSDLGTYNFLLDLNNTDYTIGKYKDVWNVKFREGDDFTKIKQTFQIYPDLWITNPTPILYSFDFNYKPNRWRKGAVGWLSVQIVPNVPRASDLEKYYFNIAISSELKISIEQVCGECISEEQDLRMVVDDVLITNRDKVFGFYKFDTRELDEGIYNVWFTLEYAGNIDISPKFQMQIY